MRNCLFRHKHTQCRPLHRGIAPVEFVFFLPIFVCFLVVIIWIARVNNAAIQASLDAEAEVIKKAVLVVEQGSLQDSGHLAQPLLPDLTKLVHGFDPTAQLFGGEVDGLGERDTGEGIGRLIPVVGSALDQQQALAHAWESQLFDFPNTSSEQPPLTLPMSVRGIAPGISDLSAFTGLLNFSGRSMPGAGALVGITKSKLANSMPKVDAAIAQLQRDINSIEQQIRTHQNASPADLAKISSLKRELLQKQSQLQKLVKGKAQGQKASGLLHAEEPPAESVD